MKDQYKSKNELIKELQELGHQNNSLKIQVDQYIAERNNPGVSLHEKRLTMAMQGGSMAWWEMDVITGKVTFDNLKVEMLGLNPEKFKHYTDFTSLVHPDDYYNFMRVMRKHLNGELEK